MSESGSDVELQNSNQLSALNGVENSVHTTHKIHNVLKIV